MGARNISRYLIPKRLDYKSNSFLEKDSKLRAYRDSNFKNQKLRQQVVGAALDPRHYYGVPIIAALRDLHILTTPWQPLAFEVVTRRFLAGHILSVIEATIGHVFESDWGKEEADQRLKHFKMMAGHPNVREEHETALRDFGLNPYHIPAKFAWNKNPEWFFGTYHNEVESMLTEIAVRICEKFSGEPLERAKLLSLSLIVKTSFQNKLRAIIPEEILPNSEIEAAREETDVTSEERSAWIWSAYHFTKNELVDSIFEHGLDVNCIPEGAEQPDWVWFNNFQNAGMTDIALGFSGYYVRDFLLRVPLDSVGPGHRGRTQELGDYTADYRAKRVPIERISVVDPYNSTRVISLTEFI
jgi:hypothetical protein